jgi:hypothetical protein
MPELAEALAVRCVVALAHCCYALRKVWSTSSSPWTVVQRINSCTRDRSLISVVVEDIKAMAIVLSSVTFGHISRLLNTSAHILARRVEHFGTSFFRGVASDCIRAELCNSGDWSIKCWNLKKETPLVHCIVERLSVISILLILYTTAHWPLLSVLDLLL